MYFAIRVLAAVTVWIASCAFGTSAPAMAAQAVVKTFNAPGAGASGATEQGTVGIGVNDFGVIVGITRDANDVRHGFLRRPDGSFTVFNDPDAGTGPFQGTRVGGINVLGAVAGTYRDEIGRAHV